MKDHISLIVAGQRLYSYSETPIVAGDSIQFVRVSVKFSADWVGFSVVAQFSQHGVTYQKLMGYVPEFTVNSTPELECFMPAEITEGVCIISLIGQKPGVPDKSTTTLFKQQVNKSGVTMPDTGIPPTPDLYSQLLAKILEAEASQEAAELAVTNAQSYAEAAQQVAEFVDTLHDEAKLFRDDAEGFANAAEGYKQEVSGYADEAEVARDEAVEAAEDANRYYASLLGLELVVNVVDGVLKLYAIGGYSPIDIVLNDRALEVWRV